MCENNIGVDEMTTYQAVLWSELCVKCLGYHYITEGETARSKVLELSGKNLFSHNQYSSLLYGNLGWSHLVQGNVEEAELEFSEESEAVADALANLGHVYYKQNKYELAEKLCWNSIGMLIKHFGEDEYIELPYLTLLNIYEKQN